MTDQSEIITRRLRLCQWRDDHHQVFVAMHSDPDVMADLGGPFSQAAAEAKIRRYRANLERFGISRWAVEDLHGNFLGYCGVMWHEDKLHPLGPHYEIGWRFVRSAWGNGYATESARATLKRLTQVDSHNTIFAYTSPENRRSQAVMSRLNLLRRPEFDFDLSQNGKIVWHGLVWTV